MATPTATPPGTPGPTPGPGGWITLPLQGTLLGLAGNGDVFVSVKVREGQSEIRRLDPTGTTTLATASWDKQALAFGAYASLVDPTDDSLVLFQYDPGRVMRMSLASGRVVGRVFRLPDGMMTPAIDGEGRIHMVCHGVWPGSCGDTFGPGAVVVYAATGKRLASRVLYTAKQCAFAAPAFLARTTAGAIRALSVGFGNVTPSCIGKPVRAVDLTPALRLGRGYVIPYERTYGTAHLDSDIEGMAGTPNGNTYLLEAAKKGGKAVFYRVAGYELVRTRLREISPDGKTLRSWGYGGSEPGIDNAISLYLAADGTIWVTDREAGATAYRVRYLSPGS